MIAQEERTILDEFRSDVLTLAGYLKNARTVSFDAPESAAEFLKFLVALDSCLNNEKHSYAEVIAVLSRLDEEDEDIEFFSMAYYNVSLIQDGKSDYATEGDSQGTTDGEAFEILREKYLMEIDGQLVLCPNAVPSPEDAGYASQVMHMADELGADIFAPMVGIDRNAFGNLKGEV